MNCLFCHKPTKTIYTRRFDCLNCYPGWNVRIALTDRDEIDYICIYNDILFIEQSFDPIWTRLFKWEKSEAPDSCDSDSWKFLLKIDDTPKVEPSSAQDFFERLLNLKAFL